jgi:hypothetical protein
MIITVLNGQEEEVVLQRMKREARDKCKTQLEALVACTKSKTISMFWECTKVNELAQSCLSQYTGDDTLFRMRMEELERKRKYLRSSGLYPPETN